MGAVPGLLVPSVAMVTVVAHAFRVVLLVFMPTFVDFFPKLFLKLRLLDAVAGSVFLGGWFLDGGRWHFFQGFQFLIEEL